MNIWEKQVIVMMVPYFDSGPIYLTDATVVFNLRFLCFVHDSIKHTDDKNPSCEGGSPVEVPGEFDNDVSIVYTYSVKFLVSLNSCIMCNYYMAISVYQC